MDWPTITVIIPTYQREAVLCDTLRTVLAQGGLIRVGHHPQTGHLLPHRPNRPPQLPATRRQHHNDIAPSATRIEFGLCAPPKGGAMASIAGAKGDQIE
jgi:hypothetical protein